MLGGDQGGEAFPGLETSDESDDPGMDNEADDSDWGEGYGEDDSKQRDRGCKRFPNHSKPSRNTLNMPRFLQLVRITQEGEWTGL